MRYADDSRMTTSENDEISKTLRARPTHNPHAILSMKRRPISRLGGRVGGGGGGSKNDIHWSLIKTNRGTTRCATERTKTARHDHAPI
jgi:hypothetical protein